MYRFVPLSLRRSQVQHRQIDFGGFDQTKRVYSVRRPEAAGKPFAVREDLAAPDRQMSATGVTRASSWEVLESPFWLGFGWGLIDIKTGPHFVSGACSYCAPAAEVMKSATAEVMKSATWIG